MNVFIRAKLLFYSLLCLVPLQLSAQIKPGADRIDEYLPLLKNKKVALVVNQTSRVGNILLPDYLLANQVKVVKIFAPEHGFRGNASAGAKVDDSKDAATGLPIISLYGKNFKPKSSQLRGVDIVVFDIQDVGVRFYTYISTLHYVMEACAESNKQLIVLDRPNPNGFYIDGPVLDPAFKSFVGMHPVPVVYGMTIGEYAQMINGEGWLAGGEKCSLKVVSCSSYTHDSMYKLPIAPSPNLSTMQAIYLYPSLCFFEGTDVSVGRGTDHPFEMAGRPGFKEGSYTFIPQNIPGKAEHPPYEGKECKGFLLTKFADEYVKLSKQLYLYWLLGFYERSKDKDHYFTPFFDKLAGTDQLRKQVIEGKTPNEIQDTWKPGIDAFKKIRIKYLLYPDITKDDRDVHVR